MIFQSANEMVNNAIIREKVAETQAKAKADRDWWDKERANIQSNFMKELDDADVSKGTTSASGNERPGSDEDAVLVEGGGPASSGSAAGKGGKGGKKRKGKK